MNLLTANLVLSFTWAALVGEISLTQLAVGFVIGFGVLWIVQPLTGASSYYTRVFAWVRLVVMFLYELVLSSLSVAWDVLTPQHRSSPAIVDVPLNVTSDFGLLMVTNLITLTPGTLSLDISPDRKTLKVHAMFGDDPNEIRRSIKHGMEKWVIDAVEGPP